MLWCVCPFTNYFLCLYFQNGFVKDIQENYGGKTANHGHKGHGFERECKNEPLGHCRNLCEPITLHKNVVAAISDGNVVFIS